MRIHREGYKYIFIATVLWALLCFFSYRIFYSTEDTIIPINMRGL